MANEITVGDLIDQLRAFNADAVVSFSGLTFNRLKPRSEHVIQLEFLEQVYRDQEGNLVVEDLT